MNTVIVLVSLSLLLIFIALLIILCLKNAKKYKLLHNIEQLRTDSFTKIIHEFKSPLTVIIGLSKQLNDDNKMSVNSSSTYLNIIEQQGRNLYNLTNQMLDVVNIKTNLSDVEWKTGDMASYIEMISETYRVYALQKGIDLVYYNDGISFETDFVPSFINKILQNLLSNAIQYSNEGDKISLVLEKNNKVKDRYTIKVIDQGKGMDTSVIPYIFNMFYKDDANGKQPGTGIGLTLTKQLVDILGGTIHVESKLGSGTTFTLDLPIIHNDKQLFSYWLPVKKNGNTKSEFKFKEIVDSTENEKQLNVNDPRITVLLAEDNKDVSYYIKELFDENKYNVILARNGNIALEMANKYIPDIIISDVIMPGKNGISLCREIKSSTTLNHIPIIMLTALTSQNDELEGLKCGADVFIRKPFNSDELMLQVERLIRTRRMLKDKFSRTVQKTEDTMAVAINNHDSGFLQHVTDIIYREIKNSEFTVIKLADELAISQSQLNKKVKDLTGYSTSIYLLQIKLNHAKKIMTTYDKSIGEVAAECGIYDVNYFSRIFKKHTGVTPSQYKRNLTQSVQ